MRSFPNKGNAARFLFASFLMGLILLAEGTIFAQDTITTFAGSNANDKFDGIGVAVNVVGDVYTTGSTPISNKWFPAVLKLNASGNVLLVEGSQSNPNPQYGTGVCGQSATNIDPTDMGGVAVDNSGTLYSAMAGGSPPILRISSGTVSCPDESSTQSMGASVGAQDVALDNSGKNLYFISQDSVAHHLVYKMDSLGAGTPTVIAGTANYGCSVGTLGSPYGLALDNRTGNLYIADAGCNVIWKVTPAGITSLYAGNSNFIANPDPTSLAGDGGSATKAYLNQPRGVAVDAYGNLYIADYADNRIRKVDSAGTITTIAGTGVPGYAGDNGDPTKAELKGPWGIAVGPGEKIYVGDSANGAVRLITPAGAQMISPPPGSTVPAVVTFRWSTVPGATSYQLDVSHNINAIGLGDIVDSTTGIITGTSLQTNIPCDGRTIYVQLSTKIGSAWTAPVSYTYTACKMVTISLSPTSLFQQGGTVTVTVTVTNLSQLTDPITIGLTESLYPTPPCLYNFVTHTWNCPSPIALPSYMETPLPNGGIQLEYTAQIGKNLSAYGLRFLFNATVTDASTGKVLDSAQAILFEQ